MDVEFNSLKELYERIKPALKAKLADFKRIGLTYIKEEDIWNYLKENKWTKSTDLNLYQMVDDVLNINEYLVDDYLKSKLTSSNRTVYLSEEE